MKHSTSILRTLLAATTLCWLGNWKPVEAQITSNFQPTPGSTDWFQVTNWNNGVPTAAGDTARIPGVIATTTADLTAPATIGQLLTTSGGSVVITGSQPLTFNNPGTSDALFDAQANTEIRAPLSIADGEQLQITGNATITLNGNIVTPGGDILKPGGNALTLAGNNSAWNGILTVSGGTLTVAHSNALGSTQGHTILQGGTIQFNQPSNEPIELTAGTFRTSVTALNFGGELKLSSGLFPATIRGPFNLQGGSTGTGDLRLVADSSPPLTVRTKALAHQGCVSISSATTQRRFAEFRVDNSYDGLTYIDNVLLRVHVPQGLGSTAAGTTVSNGELWIVPGTQEDIEVLNSSLVLWGGDASLPELRFDGIIKLNSGTLSGDGDLARKYTITQPVVLDGGANSIVSNGDQLTLNGIVGHGDLLINAGAKVQIAAPIEHDGSLEFRGGPIHLTAPDVVTGEVMVRNGGQLIADVDQHIERVRSGNRDESCCNPYGWVEATPGNSIIADKLHIAEGLVKGDIRTNGPLELFGFGVNRDIRNLVSGVDVNLHAGQMKLDDSSTELGPTTGNLTVSRASEAALTVSTANKEVHADIYLNSGSGFNFGGALRFNDDSSGLEKITVKSNIHLGDLGATIGGGARVRVEGQIYGGDLTLGTIAGGGPTIQLLNNPAYTGKTSIRGGELTVQGTGRLSNTSQVEVATTARIAVDLQPGDGASADRVDDDITVRLNGGELSVWPTEWNMSSSERIGKVVLESGLSNIRGTHFFRTGGTSHADLVIGELVREPGSLVRLSSTRNHSGTPFLNEEDPAVNDVVLENPPQVVNGILPAWLLQWTSFTTLDASGRVKPYLGPTVPFDQANSTSIVRPTPNPSTLAQDLTVHAIDAEGNAGPVDLAGHTLTVGSGGMSGARFSNGVLRPGQYSGGEFIFASLTEISASIADNVTPTSVIYAGDATINGNNTYTGKTTVIGGPGTDVTVTNGNSLPLGGDVEVSDWSRLHLRVRDGFGFNFGNLLIRNGGTLDSQCCSGTHNQVSAEKIEIQSGELRTSIRGNTPIVKTTDGIAKFDYSAVNDDFTGTVDIYGGLLITEHYRVFGRSAVTVHENGRLALHPYGTSADYKVDITLNGGALYGGSSAFSDYYNLTGNLKVVEDSAVYLFDATTIDLRNTNIRIQGRVDVAAGKTLELFGRALSRFGTELFVTDGVHLADGAKLTGNGSIRGYVDISHGAILSPGASSTGTSVGAIAMNRPPLVNDPKSTMYWGQNGQYEWEINDAEGDAGAAFGTGWDLTIVRGTVNITATAESPFVVHLLSSMADNLPEGIANLSPGEFRWKFLEADSVVGFDPTKFLIDVSHFQTSTGPAAFGRSPTDSFAAFANSRFWLTQDGNSLYINAQVVPEPGVILLIGLAAGMLAGSFRLRRSDRT